MILLEVKGISKKFINYRKTYHLRQVLAFWRYFSFKKEAPEKENFVLKDISFTLKEGESLCILGRNGSGKSTLLKIISKIIYPTEGEVLVHQKLISLLELNAGFNPLLTGIENIKLRTGLLNISKKQLAKIIDSIIEFSELDEKSLNMPVKFYSSGMGARLGFAISIHVDAKIILLDEILSVGDMAFQKKCKQEIEAKLSQGVSFIIVSHSNIGKSLNIDSALWIDSGTVKAYGKYEEVYQKYSSQMDAEFTEQSSQKKALEDTKNPASPTPTIF